MMFRELLRDAWPRRNSYSRDVAYTFLANVFTAALSVLSGILLARGLGPVGRGQLAAILALPLIVSSVGMLGLQDAIVYFGARERRRVGEYAVAATTLIFLFGLPIVSVAWWIVPMFLASHTAEVIQGSRVYLAVLFINGLMGLSLFTVRAVHNMPLWNVLRVLQQTVWVLVILALFAAGSISPIRVSTSYLAAYFLLACLALLAVREPLRHGWRIRVPLWPRMLRYSLPLAAGSTPTYLGERTDQLIIAAVLSAQELGYYAVAVSWSVLIQLPGVALFGVAFSKIAGMSDPRAQLRFIKRASWAVAAVSALTGVGLVVAAPWIIPLAFGGEFASAVPAAAILVLAGGIRNIARMLQVALKGCGKPGGIMFSEWGGVAVLLVSIAALIPRYELQGAAWSVVLSGSAAAAIAFVALKRWAAGVRPTSA